jgi:hypothetical protein
VGAKLARDKGNAVFQKSRRLFREQALLPQINPFATIAFGSTSSIGRAFLCFRIFFERNFHKILRTIPRAYIAAGYLMAMP